MSAQVLARTLALLALACLALLPAARAEERAAARPLVGALADREAWRAYKQRFVTETGRVVDSANGAISHSEGQGYGMLLALAADDRAAFERVWGWTRANLMVRDDALIAWRWEPEQRPAVSDMNNASDGDLLVAWALTEATAAWNDPAHRTAARRVAVELGRKLLVPKTPHGPLLLPAVAGFSAEDRPADGPVVNLSYWVFPALDRLPLVAPEFDWAGLSRNGLRLLARARFGPAGLPTDWVSLQGEAPRPADGFPATYAYNALRVPLYLAWAGIRHRDAYLPFAGARPAVVDVASGRAVEPLREEGYGAVSALAACAAGAPGAGRVPRTVRAATDHYYPVTLHLLALVAQDTQFPECARS